MADWLFRLPWLTDPALLLLRLTVGLMFTLSGFYKLTDPARGKKMRDTLRGAGIPAGLAVPLSLIELVGGAALMLGLLTVPSGLALFGISIVAFLTTTLPHAKGHGVHKLENLLYAPEALLSAGLLVLIALGPGALSLDRLLWGLF